MHRVGGPPLAKGGGRADLGTQVRESSARWMKTVPPCDDVSGHEHEPECLQFPDGTNGPVAFVLSEPKPDKKNNRFSIVVEGIRGNIGDVTGILKCCHSQFV